MQHFKYDQNREFIKETARKSFNFSITDQNQGVSAPPLEKPHRVDQKVIPLNPPTDLDGLWDITLQSAINNRESRRLYSDAGVKIKELSFLLWTTQGVRQHVSDSRALRTVPSAGARHSFETYLAVANVDHLDAGFYRYLPLSHSLLMEKSDSEAVQKVTRAAGDQKWMARAAVIFIWTTIPYRSEWRYGPAAHRVILLDAGHVCQNLYLACEAIGAGTCAVAAYDQEQMDQLLEVDGIDEFTIYTAAVGKRQ